MNRVKIVGAGLAGTEASMYLASRGIDVDLYEMRPSYNTEVHKTSGLAELVCSNSLGSYSIDNASGALKAEIKSLGSSLIPLAEKYRVPAGGALAVDRDLFSQQVTSLIDKNPRINLIPSQVEDLESIMCPGSLVLIATGPLTSKPLSDSIMRIMFEENLHFFDAVAPIVEYDTLDMSKAYRLDRYGIPEESSYINCPMDEIQYKKFYEYLLSAPRIELKEFEKDSLYFESCMPVEVIASRGIDTLRFGPMKPVGLPLPETGKIPYAVVQLRQDNAVATLYNLVGFQTNLKWSAQKELLSMIPGLENVNIVRYGVMHRNTYINSPNILSSKLESKKYPGLFFAGQITGVEGYTESIATGLFAAINMYKTLQSKDLIQLDDVSVLGALCKYITSASSKNFQPMNSNWGIVKNLLTEKKIRDKKLKKQMYGERALSYINEVVDKCLS